jgi:GntR family transcriptional regulator
MVRKGGDRMAAAFYQQLAEDIRGRIRNGEYPVGEPIPSSRTLEKQHGVSSTVVRDAIRQLKDEGVLMGQPGKAVYVQAVPGEAGQSGSGDLAAEVAELRAVVGRLEAGLINLYAATGVDYAPEAEAPAPRARRRRRTA